MKNWEYLKTRQRVFNKKNVLAFADYLYTERRGQAHYVPLYCNDLVRLTTLNLPGNTEPEVMCCVIGEMYEYFIGPVYTGGLEGRGVTVTAVSTSACVSALIEKARFADPTIPRMAQELWLQRKLCDLVKSNDRRTALATNGSRDSALVQRAQRCSELVRKIAQPLA